jgi:DsbC/DsbD-like thiol-disulfide interchange protein
MMKRPLLTLLLAIAPCAGSVHAQQVPDDVIRAELLPGWRNPNGTRTAALHLTLAPGWHTYWRSPGEAGIPPRFDWTGSRNLTSVAFRWPQPQVFDQNGLRTLGYSGDVILPFDVTAAADGPVTLNAAIDLGVCDTICVPVSLTVTGDLSQGSDRDPAILAAIDAAPARRSDPATCSVEPIRDGLRLTMQVDTASLGPGEFSVIELPGTEIWASPSTDTRSGATLSAIADLVPPDAQPFALDRSRVRMTLFGGGRAVEINGCKG